MAKFAWFYLALWLGSCGREGDFLGPSSLPELPSHGEQSSDDKADTEENSPLNPGSDLLPGDEQSPTPSAPELAINRHLYWDWTCEKNTLSEPNKLALGKKIKFGAKDRAKLNLYATPCPLNREPVDVVIAIDVSEGMNALDPRRNLSCSRHEGLKKTVAAYPEGSRFSLVTFDAELRYESSDFLEAEEFLASRAAMWRTTCRGYGEAAYDRAFEAVLSHLGEADSEREVRFVSDGNPSSGKHGLEIAARIKAADNTTLLVTQLGQTASINLSDYASTAGESGEKLFASVKTASELANKLAQASQPKLAAGKITIRDPRFSKAKTFAIEAQSEIFQVSFSAIDRKHYPTGISAHFEYTSDRGQKFEYSGTVFWQR